MAAPGRGRGIAGGRASQLMAVIQSANKRPSNEMPGGIQNLEPSGLPQPPAVSEPATEASTSVPTRAIGRAALLKKAMAIAKNLPGTASRPVEPCVQETSCAAPSLEKEKPPVIRKGESGTPVDIATNYVRVNVEPGKGIFEYEVRFIPEIDSKDIRYKLMEQHQDLIGPAKAFDGVTLYLPAKLSKDVMILESIHPATKEKIEVKISFRQQRRASECVHFYNVLLRKIARILGMIQMNRNYFNPSSPIMMTAEKLEIWPGYVTAVHEQEGGLMLCCDVSSRVLRTTTVLQELIELSSQRDRFQEEAQNNLIGLTVLTRYNNKTYRIDEILFNENPQCTFDYRGTKMSYIEYYKQQYGIEIRDKGQPLLLHRLKKKMMDQEDKTILICLIPELCYLTGLDDRLRKNMMTMRAIAQHTRVSPTERHQGLQKYLDSVNGNEQSAKILKIWGLSLDPKAIIIPGRVFDPEEIRLRTTSTTAGPTADWSRSLSRDILNPVEIRHWLIFSTGIDMPRCKQFVECVHVVGRQMGMKINPPRVINLPNDRTDTFVKNIRDGISPELQLVVIIVPSIREDRYSAIKTLLTSQNAVPSQVIVSRTISRPDRLRSVVQKIALQINCKLGGELWALHIPSKTFMICGVDVYHDPTRRGQSVVGFVSSTDPHITRWYTRAKYQMAGQELVDTLKLCLMESLRKYYQVNHTYPQQIVLYRDGVGDGQLSFAIQHETTQLLSAFPLVEPGYEPKFTMVVVQKKINTRLFAKLNGQLNNPNPGTIVDHTVTRRNWWDFFLVSQHVTQGTVSPTHYIVVHDGGMKPDHLQKLTYKMTHLYYNWPGTVRVPSPCLYAHKVAYLVGESIRRDVREELCDRLFFL